MPSTAGRVPIASGPGVRRRESPTRWPAQRWPSSCWLARQCWLWWRPSDDHQLLLDLARYFRRGFAHQNVNLAAHSELRKVDARLDRETGIRQQFADVVRLQVVHVGAVAVDFGGDGVPCAM